MVASGDDIESMCQIVGGNLKEGSSQTLGMERREGERGEGGGGEGSSLVY